MKRCLSRGAGLLAFLSILCAVMPLCVGTVHVGVWALLALGGLCLLWLFLSRRNRLPLVRRIAGALILTALAGGFLLSIPMTVQAFFQPPDADTPAVVVVLGAKVKADGTPSQILANRLNTAVRLLEEDPQLLCIVSGGQGENEPVTEASAMADYLIQKGIDPDRILLEDQSRNTQENLANTAALIDREGLPRQVILVTDSFHQLRGAIHARRQGLEPFSVSSYTPWGLFPAYWVREFFGICSLFLFP